MTKSKRQYLIEMAEQGIQTAEQKIPESESLRKKMLEGAIEVFRKVIEEVTKNPFLADELKVITANLVSAVEKETGHAYTREMVIEARMKISQI